MLHAFEQRLARLINHGLAPVLADNRFGLEKETLRVGPDGAIAQTPHPRALGSALTHPFITTDYSEALLEFITPPMRRIQDALSFLEAVHRFVYRRVGEDMLWANSMPCVVSGDASIPIARYGSSNAGRMKHLYRVGLGHRYGRMMQVIAGVHFNISLSPESWQALYEFDGHREGEPAYRSERYFGMMRNLLRVGWLVPYLYGASPAICRTFLEGTHCRLDPLDGHSYGVKNGTSLRLSDIGYNNHAERDSGVDVSYNSLEEYRRGLHRAVTTPLARYQALGVKVDGEYRQLNANILQIENEYYSSLRPKQILHDNEAPLTALRRRGVAYLELRSLDVNPFEPLGITADSLHLLRALVLHSALEPSTPLSPAEREAIDTNLTTVAMRGREPELTLTRDGRRITLPAWGLDILDRLEAVCDLLDSTEGGSAHRDALKSARVAMKNPAATPSARILQHLHHSGESFFGFAHRLSADHQQHFLAGEETDDIGLSEQTEASLARQAEMEAQPQLPFDQYLADYFAQFHN